MLRFCAILLLLTGCSLSEDRYLELRRIEECRIFGPTCAGDYDSEEACLGDAAMVQPVKDAERYQPREARQCIEAMRATCPVRGIDYSVPQECADVYLNGGEDSGQ